MLGRRPDRHHDVDIAIVADRLEHAWGQRPVQLERELVGRDVGQDIRKVAGVERDRGAVALDGRFDLPDRGLLGRHALFDPAVIEVPDDAPGFAYAVYLTAYVCPAASTCGTTGKPVLRAKVAIVDANPSAPVAGKRQIAILNWTPTG